MPNIEFFEIDFTLCSWSVTRKAPRAFLARVAA